MKESLMANLHWFIILYSSWTLFGIFEEKSLRIEQETQTLQAVEARMNITKRKLEEINKFKANLKSSKERVNEVVNQIEKVQKQLPAEVNDTEVQQQLGGYSKEIRIKNPRVLPDVEKLNGFYFSKDYVYSAKGTFLQFLVFFESLTKSERILDVRSLTLTHDNPEQRGRFWVLNGEARIQSFRYNKNHRESNGLKEIEEKFN